MQDKKLIRELKEARVIPILTLEKSEYALPAVEAIASAGIKAVEITLRTESALKSLKVVREKFPNMLLSAGTVLTVEQLKSVIDAGVNYAVAPGFNRKVVDVSISKDFPFFPGVCTPSDITSAVELGIDVLKFFPAEAVGGVNMLKAIYGPYEHLGLKFIPTGGINQDNIKGYLSLPYVLACGGTWLAEESMIDNKEWDKIRILCSQAVANIEKI